MVECDLAKVEVAGSTPVSRSIFLPRSTRRLTKFRMVFFVFFRDLRGLFFLCVLSQ